MTIPRLYFSIFHRLWRNIKTKFNGSVPSYFSPPLPPHPLLKNGCLTPTKPLRPPCCEHARITVCHPRRWRLTVMMLMVVMVFFFLLKKKIIKFPMFINVPLLASLRNLTLVGAAAWRSPFSPFWGRWARVPLDPRPQKPAKLSLGSAEPLGGPAHADPSGRGFRISPALPSLGWGASCGPVPGTPGTSLGPRWLR